MKLSDILKNPNFPAEFPYTIGVNNIFGDTIKVYQSWEEQIPNELMDNEITFMNPCLLNDDMPCLCLEISLGIGIDTE